MISDEYLICSALGAGKCRVMACNPQHIDLKFLPWAGIAAHLRRNGDSAPDIGGNAFCFLPLPAETGFSLHLNGYFELSANRRDIWFGDDMSGSGKLRSEWNRLLLSDVISPLYTQVLLTARSLIGPGRNFDRLWPVNVSSEIWKIVRSHVYSLAMNLPLAYSMIDSGKWCPLSKVVFLESPDNENIDRQPTTKSSNSNNMLMSILLLEKISVVSIRPAVISCMEDEKCGIVKVSPAMVRDWFRRPNNHPSLHERDNVVFLLRYCSGDLVETQQFRKLSGLPLLPLLNGLNGIIHTDDSKTCYFVPSEIEKDILTNSSFALVDTMTSDLRLNSQLRSEMFLAQTNVKMLDMPNFVKLLHHSYPSEWIGLPEIRWTSHTSSNEDSPENIAWLTKLWEYILTDREKAKRNLEYFENGLQIIPSFVGEGEKTLQTLHNQMAVVDITESNNPAVSKILWCIGIRTLDTAIFIKNSGRSSLLHGYIHPPTIHGILQALANSLPDISIDEKNERMAARFQYLNKTQKIQFRKFLRDAIAMDLTKEEILTLRSLPIFEVFALGQTEQFSHLHEGSFLPPSCAERNHLNDHFVKTTSLKDVQFLESLGLKTMNSVDYYASYLCASLSNNLITEENRLFAVTKMLQDIPALVEEDSGKDLASHVSNVAFVLNSKYEMVKPCELYDPHEPGLIDLVDDSMLPAKELRQSSLLQTLRSLGMKTKLNIDGILESAKRIEYEAKNLSIQADVDDEHICVIRKRATSLLNFLDDDNTVAQFLDELSEQNYASKPHGETNEIELTCIENSCDVIDELKSICWLPVEYELSSDNGPEARPPRRQHQLSMIGISSPVATRPKADEWICSKSTDILSLTLKSEALIELLEWNNPPNMNNVAAQIVALSQLSSEETNFHSLRHHLPTVTSQIYEILDSQIAFAKEENLNQLKSMLSNNPWIWVGDSFVSTNQVAFNAPDNARPFLYTVPDAMKSFESLLHLCGVRNTFSGSDFVHLLSSLANQLNSSICDSRQLDLAIFVSRYLSRISSEELETLDKAQIYLPSQNMVMYRASEMTFDDAPWLSAIVKRTKHVFVHPDIGNEVARTLGSKSLRDVLSANQNGMVKVPCPKHDAIRQLLFQRKSDSNEILKVVYELIELAEMKTAKQVSVALDYRTHSTMSLLHPCLAAAQGPALIVCFHDIAVEVDEIVKLTSPAHYYSNSISGNGGGGGSGFPRFGRGLCGCFSLTDCLQVLTGRSLLIFDPNGEYFIEDRNPIGDNGEQKVNQVPNDRMKKKEKASARNYGISHPFCEQFPDQFEPFLSLPYGVAESMMSSRSSKTGAYFRGTVIRIPLRNEGSPSSLIYDRIYDDEDLKTLEEELKEKLSQTLLFTYNLQSVNLDKWQVGESNCENTLNSRVGSSPLTRREHFEEMWDNKLWKKEKSSFGKVGKLFKSSWIPLRTNYALQISSRRAGEDTDITDTYTIMSILAPPRLREMACTESLSPLKLLPMVSIAAHLHRNHATPQLNTRNFEPAEGHVFVGLPTGIKTGLPFHINAPLFLHEWTGDIILGKEDDIEFQKAFPGIRNVTIFDKQQKNPQTRSLALYVWNQQAIMSSLAQLIPPMMKEIKTNIQLVVDDHKLFYRFWPYYNRIKPRFRNFVNASIYEQLANPDMDIYLTENDGFKCVGDGCFTSSEYKLNDASDFFLNKMALFTTPKLVVEDLNRFGLDGRQLTPSVARKLLRGGQHVRELTGRPREVLAILEYCLADIISATDFQSVSQAASLCRKELLGLYILPLSNGSIGKIGTKVIIANAQEQSMLPNMKKNFLWSRAIKSMEVLLRKEDFVTLCSFEHFGPKVLSQNISTILPPSWEGKDFVKWDIDRDDSSGPDKIWIQQFWRVVPIWDHDAVQLFRRWPLIPTKHGELASCGNARFILYVCNAAIDESIRSSLAENIASLRDDLDTMEKRDLMSLTAERRQNNNASTTLHNEEFWEMGKIEDDEVLVSSDSTRGLETTSDNSNSTNTASDSNAILENDRSESDGFHDDIEDDTNDAQTQDIMDNQETHYVQPYDPNTSCFRSLYEILLSIHCPLIEASFFTNEELDKILPGDRLGVTRAITGTLNQSMNYWTSVNDQRNERLHWTSLNTSQLDELLLFLSSHQGNRLSLMVSDLTTMKNLPLFETFNGTHIAISDRDHNFTLNSEADIDSLRSYLPLSLQRKLLLDKPQFKALYDDLNIRDLDEAAILQQFVLQEFDSMSISQKEIVIKNIIEKWDILKESDDFITTLKETAFVKKKGNENNGDISFVKANQLFDTRNELLNLVFDKDRSCFPAEEFTSNNALDMLVAVGLNTKIDKDTFMKCAWIVEGEQSVPKALKLFEYFNDNFGDFYDNNRGEFLRQLAEVCCVPAADGQSLGLCRFRDAGKYTINCRSIIWFFGPQAKFKNILIVSFVAAPKDKHLVFRVMPIIHNSAIPPQVMHSSLGIISPPPISVVLRQLRSLIEDESLLDRWNYKHGSIETVFSEIFSFLQGKNVLSKFLKNRQRFDCSHLDSFN
jgi:sacsin